MLLPFYEIAEGSPVLLLGRNSSMPSSKLIDRCFQRHGRRLPDTGQEKDGGLLYGQGAVVKRILMIKVVKDKTKGARFSANIWANDVSAALTCWNV
jgi:hypothetical protein